ncbi:hypothetical protein PRIC1_004394 [Phytophthora ramorum]|uniref:uncharacterized protein n=1 Tax=Phytophthora ramorum TaxID=164328 RepID=UPI0030A10A07|nr:hypothetical protein KRP23_4143 [Phytophthora ramorum]
MELSAYEAKRQRRIEANQRRLQTLHVPRLQPRVRSSVRKKRGVEDAEPVRRSLRQRQLRENGPENGSEVFLELDPPPVRLKRARTSPPQPLGLPVTLSSELQSSNSSRKSHISSSQLEVSVGEFHAKCLGTQLLPMGKQTVMEGLCPPGFVPKFSKMSGVQPWKNAVVLFVNIENDSFYDNIFHQEEVDGRNVVHFQWFGQNRWHEESPLVVRLRGVKRGEEELRFDESYYNKEGETEEPLLLFLRHTQGPYVYCGRLGYLGHRPASKPLEFRWQLLDVGSLQWEKVRELLDSSATSLSKTEAVQEVQ